MLQENLIRMYEESFRTHRELPALTDYFKGETFSYYEMAKEIAKLHLFFKKAEIRRGDKIALVGRNNPRWCITYLATITYGAVIVPILQDFAPADIVHIVNHSESRRSSSATTTGTSSRRTKSPASTRCCRSPISTSSTNAAANRSASTCATW